MVTRSRSVGRNPFAGRSMSERTEETALLSEDEARRMDLDDIVLVVDAQMPVRAKRLKYYEDRFFKGIFDKQSGDFPYLSALDQMRGLQGQIKALEQNFGTLQVTSGDLRWPEIEGLVSADKGDQPSASPDVQAYQNATAGVDQFLEKAADD